MGAKKFAVLDVSSDHLNLVVLDGKMSSNVVYKASAEYAGFQDGEFLDIPGLCEAAENLINECRGASFCNFENILVGVPGEFTAVVCKNEEIEFKALRKITENDLKDLFRQGNTYENHAVFKPIDYSPIMYTANNTRLMNPVGVTSNSLAGNVSYVLCERSFIQLFDKISQSVGIPFEYTSSMLAEVLYLLPAEIRDKGVILADVGYISTNVVYCKGDGILHSVAFSLGGGNVAGDLTTCLSVPFDHAMELTPRLNLNLQPSPADSYTVSVRGDAFTYNIKEINEVAYCRVQDIAENIARALKASATDIPPKADVLLTGSGLSTIVGAKEIIAAETGRQVRILTPELLQFKKPAQASLAALILLKTANMGKPSFFKTILSKLRRNK